MFSPIVRLETVRMLLALATQEKWEVHHMDAKFAFLNGELEKEVYVTQPLGFEEKGREEEVLRLRKAMYVLRQAPRTWSLKIDKSLQPLGFERCPLEHIIDKHQGMKEV